MEEKNALVTAFEVLGEKIKQMEKELEFANLYRETAQSTADRLKTENEQLRKMLANVEHYVDRMEEK